MRLTDLLRKSLMIATKLNMDEFRAWVQYELKGYPSEEAVPEYRVCSSTYHFKNPYHGLCPIAILDEEIRDLVSELRLTSSVESLEHCLQEKSKGQHICFPVPAAFERYLRETGELMNMPVIRIVQSNSIVSALDGVRTRVLECALQLESKGILGDGIVFSSDEKIKAQSSQVINIDSFHGVFGDINHSKVSHSFTQGIGKGALESLIRAFEKMGASQEDLEELRDAVAAEPELPPEGGFGKKVAEWIGKMVAKAAQGGLQVTIQSSSQVIGAALKSYYGLT